MREATVGWQRVMPAQPSRSDESLRVSTILVQSVLDVMQKHGISPAALLGSRADVLAKGTGEQSIALGEYQALLARAIELTREPALGIHCGLHASEASFGLVAPLVSHAATLRHGIGLVSQFSALLMEGVCVRLTEEASMAQFRCEFVAAHDPHNRSLIEQMLAGMARMLRAFGCTRADISQVSFEYPMPSHAAAYSLAFSGAERFGQPFTGIEFRAAALDRPHLHHHPELQALMLDQAERSLSRQSRPKSHSERVARLLCHLPADKLPNMAAAARRLGLSVRSLRRRLEEEGTSYRDLIQDRRYDASCMMLRNPQMTFQEIGYALGFADCTAFHRAFKRWSDLTPAEYRAAHEVND
ncbi:MAG: AraC family transcriptional regulator ligand-binding domain-containing protein [Myxococcales bacterium]|nr:AraC family transcriptional regulator ligand-binding domain-containing protein [Myxococcales bacterium]MDD9969405.1 AraC family transcriptional regulator ligand-binding domain-containing protein [Myxococcales bacterium]